MVTKMSTPCPTPRRHEARFHLGVLGYREVASLPYNGPFRGSNRARHQSVVLARRSG